MSRRNANKRAERLVSGIPLHDLWNESGPMFARRVRPLGREDVANMLRCGPIALAVAGCGHPLQWIPAEEVIGFWKGSAKAHIVDPADAATGFELGNFPDGLAYVATEWQCGELPPIILLEAHH